MSLSLDCLFKSVDIRELKLLAGKDGLKNIAYGVHMVETIEIADFLKGGEVVFTIGIGIKSDDDLFELIKKSIDKRASGIIINIGMYIDNISQKILDLCDENKFPLFTTPWDVSMAYIMKKFTHKLIQSEKTCIEVSNSIRDSINFPMKCESYIPTLTKVGLKKEWYYIICVIEIDYIEDYMDSEEYMMEIVRYVESFINKSKKLCYSTYIGEKLILLFYNSKEEAIYELTKKIYKHIKKEFRDSYFSLAMGKSVKGLENIYRSYEDCKNTLKINKLRVKENNNLSYSKRKIYELLISVENKNYFEEFYKDTLGDLEKYDLLNNTDYLHILKCYFKNNCNIKDLASSLYVHRNTVSYKLNKIEEILNCDLSDIGDRTQLYLGILIRNFTACNDN